MLQRSLLSSPICLALPVGLTGTVYKVAKTPCASEDLAKNIWNPILQDKYLGTNKHVDQQFFSFQSHLLVTQFTVYIGNTKIHDFDSSNFV